MDLFKRKIPEPKSIGEKKTRLFANDLRQLPCLKPMSRCIILTPESRYRRRAYLDRPINGLGKMNPQERIF